MDDDEDRDLDAFGYDRNADRLQEEYQAGYAKGWEDALASQQPAPQEPVAWRYRRNSVWWFSENDPDVPDVMYPEGWGKNWTEVQALYLAATPQEPSRCAPMKRRPSWRALPPDDGELSYNSQGAQGVKP